MADRHTGQEGGRGCGRHSRLRGEASPQLPGPARRSRPPQGVEMETQEFEAVLDAVRRLIREHFIPREEEIEANDEVPQDLRQRAIDMGLFGYTIRSEEHTSELQSLMRISYAVFCLKTKTNIMT